MTNDDPLPTLEAPRVEEAPAFLVAGLKDRYKCDAGRAIPGLWQRFAPHIGHIPAQVGWTAYGVCCNADEDGNFDDIAGVEVADFSEIPPELTRLRIPANCYAVFRHSDRISAIRRTFAAIWNGGLQNAGFKATDPPFFEKYGASFDPQMGTGGLEIWIPVKS